MSFTVLRADQNDILFFCLDMNKWNWFLHKEIVCACSVFYMQIEKIICGMFGNKIYTIVDGFYGLCWICIFFITVFLVFFFFCMAVGSPPLLYINKWLNDKFKRDWIFFLVCAKLFTLMYVVENLYVIIDFSFKTRLGRLNLFQHKIASWSFDADESIDSLMTIFFSYAWRALPYFDVNFVWYIAIFFLLLFFVAVLLFIHFRSAQISFCIASATFINLIQCELWTIYNIKKIICHIYFVLQHIEYHVFPIISKSTKYAHSILS